MTKKEAFEMMRKPRPDDACILCGGPVSLIGIFVPDNPMQYGAPMNKTRMIRYCLCNRCHKKTDASERVEKALQVELLGVGYAIS